MMGPKSFPRIVYITSIKGWVHDYTLLGAGYWSGRIWDRTTPHNNMPTLRVCVLHTPRRMGHNRCLREM
jgi:hypothetical protein